MLIFFPLLCEGEMEDWHNDCNQVCLKEQGDVMLSHASCLTSNFCATMKFNLWRKWAVRDMQRQKLQKFGQGRNDFKNSACCWIAIKW